jgi:hypothetical protein
MFVGKVPFHFQLEVNALGVLGVHADKDLEG